MKAHTGSRDVAVLFDRGARRGWVVNSTLRLLYPENDAVHIV
jgi:hypothetical protein